MLLIELNGWWKLKQNLQGYASWEGTGKGLGKNEEANGRNRGH